MTAIPGGRQTPVIPTIFPLPFRKPCGKNAPPLERAEVFTMGVAMSIIALKERTYLSADALFRLVRNSFATSPDHRSAEVERA